MNEILMTLLGMVSIALIGILVMLFFLWIISFLGRPLEKEEEPEEEKSEETSEEEMEDEGWGTGLLVFGVILLIIGIPFSLIGYNDLQQLNNVILSSGGLLLFGSEDFSKEYDKEYNKVRIEEIGGIIFSLIGFLLVILGFFEKYKMKKKLKYSNYKYCSNCGKRIKKNSHFCKYCNKKC